MDIALTYRHRAVTTDEVTFIRQLIATHPHDSRRELSRKLCSAWNWVQANGAPRDMVCRGLMLALHRACLIELPPVRRVPNNPLAHRTKPAWISIDDTPLEEKLSQIGSLVLRQVRRQPDEPLFNGLMEQHHYLGYSQPVGEHLKYLVYAGERPIACLAWSSAPRHLGSRDRFIGWSAEARLKNIRLLAYNTRYLILPWVKIEHLASHVLGRVVKVLSADWQQVYGHPVHFAETFVDPQRFRGTCYRAANWQYLGDTTGRGKDAPTHQPNRPIKQVLGYPLIRDFRQRLAEIGPQ
jgi:hypothetical protein